MKKATHLYKSLNRTILILTFVSSLGSAAVAARADRDDWHRHAREAREWHHRHWHNGRMIYDDGGPYVTYAPPLVVEPPPPVYYAPQPGISIVVPLHFR